MEFELQLFLYLQQLDKQEVNYEVVIDGRHYEVMDSSSCWLLLRDKANKTDNARVLVDTKKLGKIEIVELTTGKDGDDDA